MTAEYGSQFLALKAGYLAATFREGLHKFKPVIASAAKQSIFSYQSSTYGSPRRYAPRDDGLMQTFPKDRGPARRALEPDALIGQASQLLDARP